MLLGRPEILHHIIEIVHVRLVEFLLHILHELLLRGEEYALLIEQLAGHFVLSLLLELLLFFTDLLLFRFSTLDLGQRERFALVIINYLAILLVYSLRRMLLIL